jgi:hypothetical protein
MPSRSSVATVLAATLAAAVTLDACSGGGSDRERIDSTTAQVDTAAGYDTTAADDDRWNIAAGDVDAWVRGLEGATDSMRIASREIQKLKGSARINAYAREMIPVNFAAAATRASGLGDDRYFEVGSNLHDAYNALTGGADEPTSREILRHLRPDARAALERRLPRVKEIYAEQNKLTAQAGGYDTLLTKPR